jgi:DNA-binding GntR family transcriptional regulator
MSSVEVGMKLDVPGIDSSRLSRKTIARQSLPDELARRLREMIAAGELRPGSRVNMPRLCGRFGVSRTPLREALKVLAAEGLVQLMPNRSAVVQRVTREMINELIPIVGTLEALAGRIACSCIDDAALAQLEAMHQSLLCCVNLRDERSYMETENAVVRKIFAIAANGALTAFYDMLMMKLRWQAVCHRAPPDWDQAVETQKRLLHALQARDGDLWALVAHRHVQHRAAVLYQGVDLMAPGKV